MNNQDACASSIGARLRKIRTDARLSQKALGNLSGVSKQSISQIESGQTASPKASTLEPLSRRLGVSLHWLMTGRGPERVNNASSSGVHLVNERDDVPVLASQSVQMEAATLFEANQWAKFFQHVEGREWSPQEWNRRIIELYGQLAAEGGRFSAATVAEIMRSINREDERRTGGKGDERGEGIERDSSRKRGSK